VQEEERTRNEANLMTLVSDSISAMVFFFLFVRDTEGRAALFNTFGRLFEGLSDIAKAVMIILIADTLLGYHSEEGENIICIYRIERQGEV
jgi:DNA polymerase sigma